MIDSPPMNEEILIPTQVVPADGTRPGEGTLEHINLVDALAGKLVGDDKDGKEWLKEFGDRTVRQKKDDWESNSELYKTKARDLELFLGKQDNFEYGPAIGRPRPCIPIANKVVTRIYNRMAVVITKLEPIAVPTGEEDDKRVTRITKHMSWERRAKHPEWKSAMSVMLLQMINCGSGFRYVGYDPIKKRKNISTIMMTDCIVAFSEKDTSPTMEHVGRYTVVWRLRRQELEEGEREGFYSGVSDLFAENAAEKPKPIRDDDSEDPMRKVGREFEGTKRSRSDGYKEDDSNPLYCILERHSWERLPAGVAPDEEVEGGRLRRVALWVEESTKKVLRAVIMEAEDPFDRLRFRNEQAAAQIKFDNLTAEHAQNVANIQGAMQQAQQVVALGGEPPQLPQIPPPPVMEQPRPTRKIPVFPVFHYRFSESPVGFYGLGAGTFASQMNILANEVIGWELIAEQLACIAGSSGWIAEEGKQGLKKGSNKIDWGKFIQTDIPAEQLDKSFKSFPFTHSSQQLPALMEMFDDQAQIQMNAHETLSGVPGPARETATAAKSRNARATENLTMAMENIFEPLAAEFKAYARLNSVFMDNEEYFFVEEPDPLNPGQTKRTKVTTGRRDYEADFDITFDSDARLSMDEGMDERVGQAYAIIQASPFADPNAKLAAEKKLLKSLGQHDLVRHYPDVVPEPPPPSPMSQEEENAGFLQEKDHPVLPDDNHVDHLMKMQQMEETGIANTLTPTGKQIFERHRQSHRAAAYIQGTQLQAQNQAIEPNNIAEGGAFAAARRMVGPQ